MRARPLSIEWLNGGQSLGEAVTAHKATQGDKFKINWSVLGDSSLKMN